MNQYTLPLLCESAKSALVIVDIQTGLTAAMPAKVLARIQRNTQSLIQAADTLQIPVLASEQYPAGLGSMEPELLKLLPENSSRYEKTSFSCMRAGNFALDLAGHERSQIILAGMETHICILQTAMDLLAADYQVIIAADAVCSRQRDTYETALARMQGSGILVTSTESILFEWLADSANTNFKFIQSLVR
jgi:nicotinamidase-related amidase